MEFRKIQGLFIQICSFVPFFSQEMHCVFYKIFTESDLGLRIATVNFDAPLSAKVDSNELGNAGVATDGLLSAPFLADSFLTGC